MNYLCPLMRESFFKHRGRTCWPCSEQLITPCALSKLTIYIYPLAGILAKVIDATSYEKGKWTQETFKPADADNVAKNTICISHHGMTPHIFHKVWEILKSKDAVVS